MNIGLETDLEQQQDDPDLRHGPDEFAGVDPAQLAGPENHADQQFSDDRWRPEMHDYFAGNARREQNDGQLQKNFRNFHGPACRALSDPGEIVLMLLPKKARRSDGGAARPRQAALPSGDRLGSPEKDSLSVGEKIWPGPRP